MIPRFHRQLVSAMLIIAGQGALAETAPAVELKQKTIEAFNHYVQLTEARMDEELADGNGFLWPDRLPEARHENVFAQLKQGQIVIEKMETREKGNRIPVPDGLVHHWVAVVFIPEVKLPQTLALLQDYERQQDLYKPDVQQSRLLSREGEIFKVYMRFHRKAIVTAVYNAEFEIHYFAVDRSRGYNRAFSTRIAEVENPGNPDEHEKPIGKDRGYLWRLNTYGRYEEKDGGVYLQIEFIALSRSVPAILAWLVNPYIKSVPRSYLTGLLQATRKALVASKLR